MTLNDLRQMGRILFEQNDIVMADSFNQICIVTAMSFKQIDILMTKASTQIDVWGYRSIQNDIVVAIDIAAAGSLKQIDIVDTVSP